MTRVTAVLLVGFALTSSSFAQQAPESRTFAIDKTYGTLEFHGQVDRVEVGDVFEYRPRLTVTFRPAATINQTPVAHLRMLQLVATIMRPGMSADVLHRDVQAIDVLLTTDGDSATLPEVVLRVPKSVVASAEHVGVNVTDGKLLWPVGVTLK
jgi:hypothetical protein